jgi:hypothetical protein
MPVYKDIKFDPATFPGGSAGIIDFAKNFWSVMNGGLVTDTVASHASPSTLAHPKFVSDGANSHLLISFSETANIQEVAGSYSTKAALDADLVPANGVIVNCFDPDASKRGIYSKNGGTGSGSWTLLSGDPRDKAWTDYNHPQRMLELLFCSYVKFPNPSPPSPTSPFNPLPFMAPQQGWEGPQAPGGGDWRGVRLTYDMRAVNLTLGAFAKIGQHAQGNVKLRSDVLPPVGGLAVSLLPNFIQKKQLISDQLGFGIDSWGKPNDVIVEFSASDADWECLGTPKRPLALVNYGSEPIRSVLEKFMGNSYMIAHHPKPYRTLAAWLAETPAPTTEWHAIDVDSVVRDIDRIRGEIRIYGFKIEGP